MKIYAKYQDSCFSCVLQLWTFHCLSVYSTHEATAYVVLGSTDEKLSLLSNIHEIKYTN